MPRAGLNSVEVVAAGAELADECGIAGVSLAALAGRLGVKPPALYKHIDGIDDLQHRIAVVAMTELGDRLRDALQGKAEGEALAAFFDAAQAYITEHPGRYDATTIASMRGPDDPLTAASTRVMVSIRAVLSGYGVATSDLDHAARTLRCLLHGYALLRAANAFHWGNDPQESLAWMIRFVDAGLSAVST